MDAFTFAFLGWGFLSILFLVTTFFIKKNFIIVLLLNLVFNSVGYVAFAQVIGVPKPMDYNIPLYNHEEWDDSGVHIFAYYSDSQRIYLLIDETVPRLYSIPYDEDFISELKRAIEKANGDIRNIKIVPGQMYYGNANTSTHFHVQNYGVKEFNPKISGPDDNKDTNTYETH